MAKVKSRVPRGFTRFYALHLLNEKPMTGKEIIDEAERRSEGDWSPSPGLIYPLLGRLVGDGLVEEGEDGKFNITLKGIKALEQHTRFQRQLESQLRLIQKLGLSMFTAGKLLAEESMERILGVTQTMKERISNSSVDLQDRFYERYRDFLESELERIEQRKMKDPTSYKGEESEIL
jgi:DNA-binding PadR family transcriptional regulator